MQCDNAWSDIDVQLKRRYDLIPTTSLKRLRATPRMKKGTLEGVVAARNQAMTAQGPAAKGEAEGMLTGARCGRSLLHSLKPYPATARRRELHAIAGGTLNQIEDTICKMRAAITMRSFATSTP